jgi:hypothetical protein
MVTLERRPTAIHGLGYAAAAVIFIGLASWSALRAEFLGAALGLFGGLAFGMGLSRSLRLRFSIRATGSGITWATHASPETRGQWPRDAITGARTVLGERHIRPGWERSFSVQLRVHGQWLELCRGTREARVRRLVEALGEVLHLAPGVMDEDARGEAKAPEEPYAP